LRGSMPIVFMPGAVAGRAPRRVVRPAGGSVR
jgi:hypothetical protein